MSGLVLLLALAIPLSGCGESKQERAAKTVCAARSDIKTRLANLKAVTPSIAAAPQIKEEVSAIMGDIKKIVDAQGELEPARRRQVEQATSAFRQKLSATLSELTSSLSLSNAGAQLQSALNQLQSSYAQALSPIACS